MVDAESIAGYVSQKEIVEGLKDPCFCREKL
jgi:hypothetical protein